MNHSLRGFGLLTSVALAIPLLLPVRDFAQSNSKTDQWIHVRVESKEEGGETVRVNVPVEMAVKVLPAINHAPLHDGKVRIDCGHMDDIDLRTMLDAVRSAKDGEFVTVQGKEDVRIAKSAGYLYIHVAENNHHARNANDGEGKQAHVRSAVSKVEVKVPMKVVDALLSAGKDELDVVAALHALSLHGDTELVSVKDDDNTVRIWIDSKNVSD